MKLFGADFFDRSARSPLQDEYLKWICAFTNTKDGIARRKTYFFPHDAFHELLLNALIHRDYMNTAPIQIQIFKDKIDIWNIGKMPDDMKLEDLFTKHRSEPRNPNIANVFNFWKGGVGGCPAAGGGRGKNFCVPTVLSCDLRGRYFFVHDNYSTRYEPLAAYTKRVLTTTIARLRKQADAQSGRCGKMLCFFDFLLPLLERLQLTVLALLLAPLAQRPSCELSRIWQ